MKLPLAAIWKKYKLVLLVAAVGVVLMLLPGGKQTQSAQAETDTRGTYSLEETERRMETLLGKISGTGQLSLMLTVQSGAELELAELLLAEYRKVGEPWEPLVGFSAGAAEPHHVNGTAKLKRGDLVLVDAGQATDGYFADMTRTFFFGSATEEQKKVYEIVREANRRGRAAAKPGVSFAFIDAAARDYIASCGYGEYFTHRLGHSIGLGLHEEPSVSANKMQLVEEGMCFSIEPGIYLSGKFGVRIEDLVLVTADGAETLNHYPRELQIVE